MASRTQTVRLGAFVFICLLILAAMVLFFGQAPRWFSPYNIYTIIFNDAPGIAAGTPVRRSGVKVGEVSAVELDDQTGKVRIIVKMEPKFTPRTGDEALISRGLIVGESAIDFLPRNPDVPERGDMIPPNSEIVGVSPVNTRALITQATDIVPEAQKAIEQLRVTFEAYQKLSPQFNTTLKEFSDLSRSAREFIPELRKTNDNVRDLFSQGKDADQAGQLKALVGDLRQTNQDIQYFLKLAGLWVEELGVTIKKNEPRLQRAVDSFTETSNRVASLLSPENQKNASELIRNLNASSQKFDKVLAQVDDMMKEGRGTLKTMDKTLTNADQAITEIRGITKPLAEKGPKLIENLDTAVDQFSKTMVDVRALVKVIGNSEGTIQKLISDPALYNNLAEAICSVNKMMPRLDRILKDAEIFADKIARHPESLGIGGAVRPSSGLKEMPSSTVPPQR